MATFSPTTSFMGYSNSGWNRNPNYVFPSSPASAISVGFAFAYVIVQTGGLIYTAHYADMYSSGSGSFSISNTSIPSNVQTDYIPPVIETQDYLFGDPLAQALEEEVLHEIAAVLEYN